MSNIKIKVAPGAIMIKRQTIGSAGHDLHAFLQEDITLKPQQQALIPTGIFLEMPTSIEAQIRPRSGITKKMIDVKFGTIDSDYRGEVAVFVYNASTEDFIIQNGIRIAQMVFNNLPEVRLEEVEELSETPRGEGGFGSTGLF